MTSLLGCHLHSMMHATVMLSVAIALFRRCFADTRLRTFDDSSLRILCNFSELVTRELERDIALAEARQQQPSAAISDDADAAVAHLQIAAVQSQKGQPLLRSLDCVTR